MNCCIVPSHSQLPPPENWPIVARLLAQESALAERSIARRKRRVLQEPEAELVKDLRYYFRAEAARVLDLMRQVQLPYVPKQAAMTATVSEANYPPSLLNNAQFRGILDFILNGQSVSPYEASLDEFYRTVMPRAMDAATAEAMAAAGIGIGGKLGRFPGAEKWIVDHAIQFGKKYAPSVTETTNHQIRVQLARGWAENEPLDKLMARVRKVYDDCSTYRAEVIARTEGNRAFSNASHEAYDQLGADGHFWIISGSEYAVWPEVCAVNASKLTIPMAESFEDSEGDPIPAPPAHPNCLCDEGIDFSDNWQPPEWVGEVE